MWTCRLFLAGDVSVGYFQCFTVLPIHVLVHLVKKSASKACAEKEEQGAWWGGSPPCRSLHAIYSSSAGTAMKLHAG